MARRRAVRDPSKEPAEEGSESQRPRKKYNRHTPQQIVHLEETFKGCPHPDETQREALSRQLGMEPRQIKFWFQNRRTQQKTQHEREDTSYLREENDKIRCENITMREALKKLHCPQCGVQPVEEEDGFDAQKLRMENDCLREELEHVSTVTSKHLGRPFTLLEPTSTVSAPSSSLDLSVGGMSGSGVGGPPGLEFDHLGGGSSAGAAGMGPFAGLPFQMPAPTTNMERPMMMRTAAQAMDELIRIAQAGEHLWVRGDERDTLNVATYDGLFSKRGAGFRPPDISVEGSRVGSMVFMNAVGLVDVFMDTNKWMEFFPGIVSKAHTVDVLVNGMCGRNESLIMMHEELHMLTPVVPTREFTFLRYCKQMDHGLWVVGDVSMDGTPYGVPPSLSRRLPSGCLIADIGNGYSQVIWVEHVEIEQTLPINVLYQNLVQSGGAFGAHRWVAALQRACDRIASFAAVGLQHPDPYGVTPEGNRGMMKLSQRMVNGFCASLTSSPTQQWTTLSGAIDVSVRVSSHPSDDMGQNSVVVLGGAASIWLPVPGDVVFAFVRDETMRSFGWNVQGHDNQVQELLRIANGGDPSNCITLLSGQNSSQNGQLILQESCTDASGSLVVVYSPIDFPSVNMVVSGEDPSVIPLLPSGFTILPDGSAAPPACLLTVAFQMVVSSSPSSSLSAEYVSNINNLVTSTVQQIRAAFNYAGGP